MPEKRSRKASLNPKIRKIIEDLEWNIRDNGDGTIDICQYSPAGEDFFFTVNAKNAEQEIYDYYDSFDVDDHIEMWVEAKRNGRDSSIPSIRRLVEDAEAICEMLKTLAGAVLGQTTIGEQIAAAEKEKQQ